MVYSGIIAIKKDDTYKYISVQRYAEPEKLGRILCEYYTTIEKTDRLINLGDICYAGVETISGESLALTRDLQRDWVYTQPQYTKDINEVLANNYAYIYDSNMYVWYMAKEEENYQLKELETVIN